MGIFGSGAAGQSRYSGEEHNLQLTQSVFGTTVPIVFGTCRVPGKLLFYGGFKAKKVTSGGGKGIGGGKNSSQYDYSADVDLALASGSAAGGCRGILSVWDQQGKLANQSNTFSYTVPTGGGSIQPNAGGAPIQMDLGASKVVSYSVTANDYASGGVRTIAGTQNVPLDLVTGTPGAGQYAFDSSTGTYHFSSADAGAQVSGSYSCTFSLYYFETVQAAEIPGSPYQVSTDNQSYFYADNGVVRVDTGARLTRGTDYTESGGVYTFAAYLAGVYVYIDYTYTSNDPNVTNSSKLNLTFFNGAVGQSAWSYMQSKYPSAAFGYTGICHVGANPMALGTAAATPQYNYELVGLNVFPGGGLDAHPCDIFRTVLSDALVGVGFPSANIDAWTDAYAYWAANGYLVSKKLDTQVSVFDAMNEVIKVGNVGPVWSGGLLKLVPYGDTTAVGNGYTYTPNTTPVVTLTWDDLLEPTEQDLGRSTSDEKLQCAIKAPQDCWNYVQAQYTDRLNHYNNGLISAQNSAFIADYGRRIQSPQSWEWITSKAAASWALDLYLKSECYKPNTYKFWLPFRFSRLEPMDPVMLPTGEVVRLQQVDVSPDGRIALEAEQFTYGSGNVTIYPKQDPVSYYPGVSTAHPGDAFPVVVQSATPQLGPNQYAIQIAAAGSSSDFGGANIYISTDNSDFTFLDKVSAPAVVGLLSSALGAVTDPDTTSVPGVDLTLAGPDAELSTVTQALADQFATLCCIVDPATQSSELISYEAATLTAAGRYNLSYLRRGVYGTPVLSHSIGASFAYLGSGYPFAVYHYAPVLSGQTIYIKLQAFNLLENQLQDLSLCKSWPVVLGGYVAEPANVTVQDDSTTAITLSDGSSLPRAYVKWTPPADPLVTSGGAIQVRHALVWKIHPVVPPVVHLNALSVNPIDGTSGGTVGYQSDWIEDGSFSGTSVGCYIDGIESLQGFVVQVRAVRSSGAASNWAQAVAATSTPAQQIWALGSTVSPILTYPGPSLIRLEALQPAELGANVTQSHPAAGVTDGTTIRGASDILNTVQGGGGINFASGLHSNQPLDQQNLIVTPTFESGKMGSWNGSAIVSVSGQDFTKAIQTNGRDCNEFAYKFPVVAGQRLYCAGWVNTAGTPYTGTVGVAFMNASGTYVNWAGATQAAGLGWGYVGAWITVPAGAVWGQGWLQQDGYSFSGSQLALFAGLYVGRSQPGSDVTGQNTANDVLYGGGRAVAQHGADVTGSNTSADTSNVNGVAASSISPIAGLMPSESGSNVTAAHALTVAAYPSRSGLSGQNSVAIATSGDTDLLMGWSLSSAGTSDTFNFFASVCFKNSGSSPVTVSVLLYIDSAPTTLTTPSQFVIPANSTLTVSTSFPFSGLSAGSHSVNVMGNSGGASNVSVLTGVWAFISGRYQPSSFNSMATAQRIY